jgi:hypothetical protein
VNCTSFCWLSIFSMTDFKRPWTPAPASDDASPDETIDPETGGLFS